MSLVKNIKGYCKLYAISIAELERRAGISKNSIFRWDRKPPGVEKVKRVADELGVTVDALLEE